MLMDDYSAERLKPAFGSAQHVALQSCCYFWLCVIKMYDVEMMMMMTMMSLWWWWMWLLFRSFLNSPYSQECFLTSLTWNWSREFFHRSSCRMNWKWCACCSCCCLYLLQRHCCGGAGSFRKSSSTHLFLSLTNCWLTICDFLLWR